ncbi:hypothetical protein SETIT_4G059800v2 [Setaria italica]|uniref:Uncharacterized protein n=1 Tax=Setaria italica TaxID=4555 RepID=A0A368QR95_SETIT|nr:hypothetical protein SETIT_4G059800v2 [Setaria italica]
MRRGKGMQEAGPAHQTAHITLPWLVDKTPRPFSPSLFGQRRAAAARQFSVRPPPAILLSIASLHPPRSCAPAPSQINRGS